MLTVLSILTAEGVPLLLGAEEQGTEGEYRWLSDSAPIGTVPSWKSNSTSNPGASVLGIMNFGGQWVYNDLNNNTQHYFICQAKLGMLSISGVARIFSDIEALAKKRPSSAFEEEGGFDW